MSEPIAALRCAVHPARVAVDDCPACGRPRCDEDVRSFGGNACAACYEPVVAAPPRSTGQRVIAAGLSGIPVAVIGGWIYAQYVEVPTFSWLVPILIGVAASTATTSAWQRGGGWSRPAVAIAAVAALCGTAFGFRLFPHGPHDPLHPWHLVGTPYICTVIGAVLWPLALGPPRKSKRTSAT